MNPGSTGITSFETAPNGDDLFERCATKTLFCLQQTNQASNECSPVDARAHEISTALSILRLQLTLASTAFSDNPRDEDPPFSLVNLTP